MLMISKMIGWMLIILGAIMTAYACAEPYLWLTGFVQVGDKSPYDYDIDQGTFISDMVMLLISMSIIVLGFVTKDFFGEEDSA